jgi:hypothetical protein
MASFHKERKSKQMPKPTFTPTRIPAQLLPETREIVVGLADDGMFPAEVGTFAGQLNYLVRLADAALRAGFSAEALARYAADNARPLPVGEKAETA